MTTGPMDTHTAYLRLMLAVLDNNDEAAHDVMNAADLVALCHLMAHKFVMVLTGEPREDNHHELVEEIRNDILADLETVRRDAEG